MSPTSYRCSTSRCLDGKDRRLLLLKQVYTTQIETSAERGYLGFLRVSLGHYLAQLYLTSCNKKRSPITIYYLI
jgi:hypothetical protein